MENYNDLIQQLNEQEEAMKNIFQKRMSILDKIISIENQNNIKLDEKESVSTDDIRLDFNIKFVNEYNYFTKKNKNLDKKYNYDKMFKLNKNYEDKYSSEKIDIQTVCYQGLPYSYSESAAKGLFVDKTHIHRTSFKDVFETVHDSIADVGVVPIENSTAGYVNDVYDLLLKYDLYINYNYTKKIDHCLAGVIDSSIEDIKVVFSHPQAIMQCREYIDNHSLKAVNEINTAVAAQKIFIMNKKNNACICSPEAAINYGLKILQYQINPEENYTRFGAISKYLWPKKTHNRVSIVFRIPHETGALDDVISIFSYYNINLSSIYSRPDLKSTWKYMFYIDFEGNILNYNVNAILYQLKKELPYMKVLGSFEV